MTNAHLLKGVLPYGLDAAPGATPAFVAPPQSDAPVSRVPLEAVLCTGELARRAARRPDYDAENRALARLVQALAEAPASIFQTISDTLLQIFQVDSAGISLLTKDEKSFCCHAVAGMWQAHAGGVTPRNFSPCGDVFDCNTPLLFTHFERRYAYLATMPSAQECLVLPFYVNRKAVGTLWIVAHDARRTFDAEDLRQLTSLGGFASAAFQASQALNSALEQDRTLLGLKQELVEARQAIEKLRESEDHYRMRFESVEEGFCVIEKIEGDTLDFRYVGVNSSFTAQTSLKDVLGKTLRQVLPDEFEERIRIYDAVIRTGEPIRIQREFGAYGRTLELYAFRLGDGAQKRVAINFQDITERKQAEMLTACQAAELASLYATAPVGLFMLDTNLRFVRINQVMAHLNGLPAEQHTGLTLRDLLTTHLADATEPMLRQVLETGLPVLNYEVYGSTTPRPDEQRHWLMNCHPVRAENGTIRGVHGAVQEITERKQAEEALRQSEQRFRALFDRGPIAMYSCDTRGVIQEFNRGVVKLWGREPTDKDIEERFCGTYKAYRSDGTLLTAAQNPLMAVLNGEIPQAIDVEAVIERPDGAQIRVIANIVPLKNANGDITGAINCVYDITERSRLERQTQQQAQALIDLHRRKDEFLAMLSHELRNPLAPLASAVHMLQLQKNEEPLQQHARQVIERQLAQLKRLIDDLLEISRITHGNVRLRPEGVSVGDIVAHALETTQPLIAQRRHELTVSLPPQPLWLHADATRLEQVLVNLLTNAIKYTDEGGRIWLSVALEDDVGPKAGTQVAVLRVRDNGIGMSPELLPHIFDIFTQAERTIDRSEGGLGIGLRLVQQLVELHAGTVNVHSVPGQGSEFVVRLPVTPPPFAPLPIQPPATPERSLRVLAVDDHVDAVQNLALLLEIAGHEVQLAYDGPSALEAAQAMRPDVMLLDIGLPGLTGYEVAQRIRQQPALKDVVLVALTGYGREADRKRSKSAGFDYHLVKPAGFGEVEEILARVAQQLA